MSDHTTREDRIYAHYKALRRRWNWSKSSKSALFMFMAMYWRTPIREIKAIIAAKRPRPLLVNGKPIPPEVAFGPPGDFARYCDETDPGVLALLDAENETPEGGD